MTSLVLNPAQQFKAFQENMEWFRRHYPELRRKYPNKFVAINNQRVIDTDNDSFKLINRLRKEHGDLRTFAIEHVTDGKVELIL